MFMAWLDKSIEQNLWDNLGKLKGMKKFIADFDYLSL